MELALAIRDLWQHRLLLVLGVVIAAAAAVFSVSHKSLQYSSASTQVLVDSDSSVIGNASEPFEPLSGRAQVYSNFMTSPAILEAIGRKVGLSGSQIYAAGPVDANLPRVEQEPTDLKRNVEITGETKPYRLSFENQGNTPTITINAQAPTTTMAVGLANAAAASLGEYVANVESTDSIPTHARVAIRQLGSASGAVVDGGISKTLAGIVFIAVFLLWCVLVLVGTRFRRTWRESAALQVQQQNNDVGQLHGGADRHPGEVDALPVGSLGGGGGHHQHDLGDRAPLYLPPVELNDDRATPVPTRIHG
jgi:capsular polysaccharide biosynthesis protein